MRLFWVALLLANYLPILVLYLRDHTDCYLSQTESSINYFKISPQPMF